MNAWQRFTGWSGWPWIKAAHTAAVLGDVWLPRGEPVDMDTGDAADATGPQGWQVRAWSLWKPVGELHAPTSYIARIVSRRMNWRQTDPAELDVPATNQRVQLALGQTSMEEFVRLVALNLQVAGELWVVQTPRGWDVLSVVARNLQQRVAAARAAGLAALRVYDADPSDITLADSAFRGVLDPAEDLLTLSALSRAQSRSRIAQAGMLLVPSQQQFEGGDPFGSGLEQAMVAGIKDVNSPSAVVPIKVTMDKDLIETVKHVKFDRPYDDKVPEKIERATRRIAIGMDMPAELLLGLGENSSHWGAWAVMEDTYKGTIAPLSEKAAGVLELVVGTVEQSAPTIVPDPTELLARRSTTRDAFEGARLGAVGLDYVRRAMGAAPADAPTAQDVELIRHLSSKGRGAPDDAEQVQGPPQRGDPNDNPATE